MKKIINTVVLIAVFLFASCNQEYLNPSSASQTQVVSDVTGLITLANGLSYKYSITRVSPNYTLPTTSGLLTRELVVLNAGNTDEQNLFQGGASVIGNNGVITNLWNQSNLIKSNADLILNNLAIVTDQGTKGALQAHAAIFKALALGNLAMFWQQAPVATTSKATFVDRIAVLNEAISILEAAGTELAKAPITSAFSSRIAAGIDYANTINALIARYSLMAGNNDKAIAAANLVSLAVSVKSEFRHDDLTRNALFESSFGNKNVSEPLNNKFSLPLTLETPLSDGRIAFFFSAGGSLNLGRASFFTSNSSALPIYRAGEVTLVKAEAFARKNDLPNAIAELNKILQKLPAGDSYGIGANQPAYSGANTQAAILTEIYRQRCIELYMTGMRLEDSRRFGRPASERSRDFLPYPFSERDNNPNTPADPAN
jgi:starch-binding outer membrane protein, SusD/RagB family